MLRFVVAIPEILTLFGYSIEESTILIRTVGLTHYELVSETSNAYWLIIIYTIPVMIWWLIEGLVVISYSFALISFLTVWLKTKFIWCLWILKVALLIAHTVFRV